MKTYKMKLLPQYFNYIKNGTKRLELRLNDEKRKDLEIKPMSEEEAILQMELLDHDFFVFKNLNNEVCILYKRKDNKYGIIETK